MKRIILSIVLFSFYYNTFAQDYYTTIYTPTGVSIEAFYRVEFSADQLNQVEVDAANWISTYGSNAVRVAPASRTYNCHNFAWHNSDGGSRVWVNQFNNVGNTNLAKYWSDNSPTYLQTTVLRATKAFYPVYPDGDHSAKVITTTLFESKWGNWPRYRHSPADCPYNSSNLQYYYVPVNGDDLICSSKTYSTLNISGASYNWTGSKVSISGSGSSITASKTSNGSGWVKTQISSPHSGTVIDSEIQTIWLGKPGIPITNPTGYPTYQMSLWQIKTICVSSAPGASSSLYNWTITGSIDRISSNPHSICTVEASSTGVGNFYVTSQNSCGTSLSGGGTVFVSSGGGGGPLIVTPNPASTDINITFEDETQNTLELNMSSNTEKDYLINFINNYGVVVYSKKTIDNNIRINVSNWEKGLYHILITNMTKSFSGTFIVE